MYRILYRYSQLTMHGLASLSCLFDSALLTTPLLPHVTSPESVTSLTLSPVTHLRQQPTPSHRLISVNSPNQPKHISIIQQTSALREVATQPGMAAGKAAGSSIGRQASSSSSSRGNGFDDGVAPVVPSLLIFAQGLWVRVHVSVRTVSLPGGRCSPRDPQARFQSSYVSSLTDFFFG